MYTKTQIKIMQLFVSQITKRFSLRKVGKELNMHQALTYRASKFLLEDKLIVQDDEKYILNYKKNHQELAYFEHLRSKNFFNKPNNKTLAIFIEDIIEKFPYGYFTLLIFGSATKNKKPRDIDVLLIIEKTKDIETAEKVLYNISRNYTLNLHTIILSFESVFEMLGLREDNNIMNQVLNNHLICYGGELFFRLIKKGRK
ncbi:hypothetical protein HOD20_04860 [archaeon]|jgi:hypothetical protein|nr:hypothetical protein [archaeon]MBT6820831.1 hypothetical protein [archaeon]